VRGCKELQKLKLEFDATRLTLHDTVSTPGSVVCAPKVTHLCTGKSTILSPSTVSAFLKNHLPRLQVFGHHHSLEGIDRVKWNVVAAGYEKEKQVDDWGSPCM